jgi:outer membrane protein TolC
VLAGHGAAAGRPPRLSLPAALRVFRTRSLDLLLSQQSLRQAQAQLVSAGANPNPVLGGQIGKLLNYDPSGSNCQPIPVPGRRPDEHPGGCSDIAWTAQLSDGGALFFNLAGKRYWHIAAARAVVEASRQSLRDARRTLELAFKLQYLQVQLAVRSLETLEEVRGSWEETLVLDRQRFESGAISDIDLSRVEVAALSADQDVESGRQTLAQARAGLSLLLAVRGGPDLFDVEPLPAHFVGPPAALIAVDSPGGAAALLHEALRLRPDLLAARAQVRRARASVVSARRLRIPDVVLSLIGSATGYGQLASSPPTVAFGVSMPLPVFYGFRGEIAQAIVEHRVQQLTQQRLEAQVASEVVTAQAALRGATRRLAIMDRGLIERARRARDLSLLRYRRGADRLLDYLDAQRTFIAVALGRLRNLADCYGALYQLEAAAGQPLAGGP